MADREDSHRRLSLHLARRALGGGEHLPCALLWSGAGACTSRILGAFALARSRLSRGLHGEDLRVRIEVLRVMTMRARFVTFALAVAFLVFVVAPNVRVSA